MAQPPFSLFGIRFPDYFVQFLWLILINALNLQKGTLEANGGDQAAVDAIAERKKALGSEMQMNGTRPPEILTIIPLPSLHRALGDYDLEQ